MTTQIVKSKPVTSKNSTKAKCPYCTSELTDTEMGFFPCTCSFQACLNCYKDNSKGLCPKCKGRLRLDRLPSLMNSRRDELKKLDSERSKTKVTTVKKATTTTTIITTVSSKSGSSTQNKTCVYNYDENSRFNFKKLSFSELSRIRVIQKNLVYVIGLSPQMAHQDVLERGDYFGQYGKITKVVVNKSNAYNPSGPNGPSYSAYLTFSNDIDASIAILAVDQYNHYDRVIRASYGTTKYCTYFLKEQQCPNPDCLYLHSIGKDQDSFLKQDDNFNNKNIFLDQQRLAIEHLSRHFPEAKKRFEQNKPTTPSKIKPVLPALGIVQAKILKNIEEYEREKEEEALKKKEQKSQNDREEKKISKDGSQDSDRTDSEKENKRDAANKSGSDDEDRIPDNDSKADDSTNGSPLKEEQKPKVEEPIITYEEMNDMILDYITQNKSQHKTSRFPYILDNKAKQKAFEERKSQKETTEFEEFDVISDLISNYVESSNSVPINTNDINQLATPDYKKSFVPSVFQQNTVTSKSLMDVFDKNGSTNPNSMSTDAFSGLKNQFSGPEEDFSMSKGSKPSQSNAQQINANSYTINKPDKSQQGQSKQTTTTVTVNGNNNGYIKGKQKTYKVSAH